jgi:hypothetical protein
LEREYDIFEVMPDGALLWRAVVVGHENAIAKLREVASKTKNECRVIHVPTNAVIATSKGSTATEHG